ncbi:MAG: hypothetical protein JW811_10445 [Clostridiales bacterium]|nr:hypothetical protein [Clostridiales bacterium]
MKNRVFLAALVIVLLLATLTAANAESTATVTITQPDGTVIEMSLEDYMKMMGYDTSTGSDTTVDAVPWPTYSWISYPLDPVIKWESYRVIVHSGPSWSDYTEGDGYKPYKIARADGLFIENDSYVLVDMYYTTEGVRREYFTRSAFHSTGGIPEVEFTGYPAVTTEKVTPRFGPGIKYSKHDKISLAANTELVVYFEEDGYVFADFEIGFQLMRAWFPVDSVKPVSSGHPDSR